MSSAATSVIDSTPWDSLQHAYGAATDVPPLLRAIAKAHGRNLYENMDELCSRVLHQGTIYSASPAVARAVIEMLATAGPREKASFYGLLTGFAESARKAIADGRAMPSCSGGEPEDGIAIREAILGASAVFHPDLTSSDGELRAQVAELLTAFSGVSQETAQMVRRHYLAEPDARVRHAELLGLERVRERFADWPEFLSGALEREGDPANRYVLRRAQVDRMQAEANPAMVDDLVSTFVQVHATGHNIFTGDERFFRAVHGLGEEDERRALLRAMAGSANAGLSRVLAERLLRIVFADSRKGWNETSYSYERHEDQPAARPDPMGGMFKALVRMAGLVVLAKLCPPLFRRRMNKIAVENRGRMEIVQYWGVKGDAPEIPQILMAPQREVLSAIADDAVLWTFRTNLWELFDLPETAALLRAFVGARE